MPRGIRWILSFCLVAICAPAGRTQSQDQTKQLSREIFKQLIEINTTDSVGNVTTAAEAMARRLRDGGFAEGDIKVAGPNERKKNLVARFRGTGKRKPILFIGHLDVVEALRTDWTTDPFEFVDEEGGSSNGVDWLLREHRDWVDAEYCINLDGGEFEKDKDKRLLAGIQASEKVYVDFQFESLNPGGHSSVPSPDNAIYHLAGALSRLQSFSFATKINEITRSYFEQNAVMTTGQVAADMKAVAKQPPDSAAVQRLSAVPYYNSLLHTTCVATMLSGGHAPNALPQTARANVNCRIFPGEDPEEVHKTLERVANDPKVKISTVPQLTPDGKVVPVVPVPPSPLLPEVTQAMEKVLKSVWPGVPLVATMSTGATDGKYMRIAGIPTYGISCMFFDKNDNREHGKDERVGVQDFYDGVDFNYNLMKELSSPR